MAHVVLLGDSILDNAAYVSGGPDVAAQLRRALPTGCRVTLLAVDGSATADVSRQLGRVPADATHLVLSAGGNDALGHIGLLQEEARSVAEVLDRLARMKEGFDLEYRGLLEEILRKGLPTVLCTIYEGALGDPVLQRRAATALAMFNEVILRAAFEAKLPVIDLRIVCRSPEDYANPIEPSVIGGSRIAAAIARAVAEPAAAASRVVV